MERIMKDKDAIYGLMIPFLFIWGMCGALLILVIIDAIFGLGLAQ
jgi:hypothetical protein